MASKYLLYYTFSNDISEKFHYAPSTNCILKYIIKYNNETHEIVLSYFSKLVLIN